MNMHELILVIEGQKHGTSYEAWKIAASAGCFRAMHRLIAFVEKGVVSRESIDSTLNAYNNSCVEMRSEARDAYIRDIIDGK